MALTNLSQITTSGISTLADVSLNSITGVDATFTGNVSIGGTLTYDDVTNIDSVGLITARSGIRVLTGTATTALVVEGNARVTGILTVGTSSLTLDGTNNVVNVGTALTLGHTQGLQFHTQNLHSQGFDVNNVNATGIVTAHSGIDIVGGSKKLNFDSGASGVFEIYRESSGNAYITATNQFRMYSGDRFSFSKIGGIDFLILDTTGNTVTGNTNIIGNVGIGTNNPAEILHLNGATTKSLLKFTSGSYGTASSDGSHIGINFGGLEVWHKENNYLRFGTNNIERLRIKSDGKVGIGTDNPGTILDARGNVQFGDGGGFDMNILGTRHQFSINGDEKLRITSGGELVSTNGTLRREVETSSFAISGGTASNSGANINLYGNNHGSLANVFRVRTGSTERFRIDSSGVLGIGGNGTGNGLGVFLRRSSTTTNFYEASDGTKTMITGVDSTNDYVKIGSLSSHRVGIVANNGEKLSILPGGNIGINNTSPTYQLSINGTGAVRNEIVCTNNNDAGAGIYLRTMNGGSMVSNATIRTNNAGTFQIYTGTSSDAERLRITSGGEVLINPAGGTAVGRLTVAGDGKDITFGRTQNSGTGGVGRLVATGNIVYLQAGANASSGSAADLVFGAYGGVGEKLRIQSNGRVGINRQTSSFMLDIVGNSSTGANCIRIVDGAENGHGSHPAKIVAGGTYYQEMQMHSRRFAVHTYDGSSIAERFRVHQSGNVGINDTNPLKRLSINNGSSDEDIIRMYNNEVGINFGAWGTGSSYPREATINGTRFDSGTSPFLRIAGQGGIKLCSDLNNERVRIDSSGIQVGGTYRLSNNSSGGNSLANPYSIGNVSSATIPNYQHVCGMWVVNAAVPCNSNWYNLLLSFSDSSGMFHGYSGDASSRNIFQFQYNMTSPAYGVNNLLQRYNSGAWNTGSVAFQIANVGGSWALQVKAHSYYNTNNNASLQITFHSYY